MSDDKESYKRDSIKKIYEEKVTEDIEVLKLGKSSSQKNIGNIEKYFDERKLIYTSDDKESDERDQISENDEEIVTDDIEVLKLRN